MRHLNRLVMIIAGIASLGAAKNLLNKYEVLIFDKEDLLDDEEEATALDLRGTPTHKCVCGSEVFYVKAAFENYEISQYFLDMICSGCGSLATAPTLLDRENME